MSDAEDRKILLDLLVDEKLKNLEFLTTDEMKRRDDHWLHMDHEERDEKREIMREMIERRLSG